ncbi:MAG: cysteine desulfurase [Halofilum sp. (in: g-proteobacteria)]|nr:cysteine desulfurase [Halofilum sp. (in: g-proteobacteria)]
MSAATDAAGVTGPLDVERLREDFPILRQQIGGHPLVYLDNAATTQKPLAVIDTLDRYYRETNANIHRGVHTLAERATAQYEDARERVAGFINAAEAREIVFTRGTTEAVNLVAQSYLRPRLAAGDEIVVSEMEHHSNIVPWQLVAEHTGARIRVLPITDTGELELDDLPGLLNERTRLVAIGHVSNALGTVNPVARIVATAHERGVPVLVDGAQSVPHFAVDVQALGADFYCFSGHKMFGPTGIGVLYAQADILEQMPPYQGGGEMISKVSFEGTEFNVVPHRFEAGTPHIAGAIGLGAAVDYLRALGLERVAAHEADVLAYAHQRAREIPGLRVIGEAPEKAGVLSFVIDGVHPNDLGMLIDQEGVAVRTGHHCAMPVMEHFGITGTARASFAFYNTRADVDRLVEGIDNVRQMLA